MRAPRDAGQPPDVEQAVREALDLVAAWEEGFGPRPGHASLEGDGGRFAAAWEEFAHRMAENFPFFHPRFAGQMLKPPHPVAVAGYLAAMLVNPNNHSLDGGPVTSELEVEAVAELAAMFHLPAASLGHLTSSGTIANLEALWVARQLAPDKVVIFGDNAHYTHARMCDVLGIRSDEVPSDASGHLDAEAVERRCRRGDVGTVVVTAGTTGLGAVDPIDEALGWRERHGVRVHVDAAYGGFFSVFAWDEHPPVSVPADALRAIAWCDSVVVDPHKHGLQPYGCGAVLFADPSVGALYRHDSPYTYFTSAERHLGEISLECSRAGAAAAALWLTLRTFPLSASEGLGPVLAAGRRAAIALARGLGDLGDSAPLRLHVRPELDIVTYFPWRPGETAEDVSSASARMLAAGMASPDPVWLSTLEVGGAAFSSLHRDIPPGSRGDRPVTVLRSVLMKPEHEPWVGELLERLVDLVGSGDAGTPRG